VSAAETPPVETPPAETPLVETEPGAQHAAACWRSPAEQRAAEEAR